MRKLNLTDEVVRNLPFTAAGRFEEFADATIDNMRVVVAATRKVFFYAPDIIPGSDIRWNLGQFPETATDRARALSRQLIKATAHTSPRAAAPRARVLEPVELQAYLAAGERLASASDRVLARSLLLTGLTLRELTAMKWSDLDLDRGLWVRSDHMGRLVELTFSDAMVTLLNDLRRTAPADKRDCVFHAASERRSPKGFVNTKAQIDVHMEERISLRPWNWHDLRRSVLALLVWHGLERKLAWVAIGMGDSPARAVDRETIRAALNRHAGVVDAIRRGDFPGDF